MSFVIREAFPDDAAEMAQIEYDAWQASYRGIVPDALLDEMNVEEKTERYRESFEEGRKAGHPFVAIGEGNTVMGVATGGAPRDDEYLADETLGEFRGISVVPSQWKGGAATPLHDAILERLRRKGFTKAYSWVVADNERAIRFFTRKGWERTDVFREYDKFDAPVKEVQFRIDL